jgi:cytosine/adenosine deaminase-related metal-dependent hydrolase
MHAATILIEADYVLPGPRAQALMADAAVVVSGSRIAAVGAALELKRQWADARVVSLPGCLLMPGLVNAHQHGRGLSQIQLGYHDDFLECWIAGRRARGILDGHAVTRLAAARMIANGVTATVHANYSYGTGDYERELRDQIRAYEDVGIRATMCVGAMDRGGAVYPPHEACFMAGLDEELRSWLSKPASAAYAGDGAATLALMKRLRSDFADHALIRLCYGPAGPQWVSDDLWRAIARDARDNDLGLHLHALESPAQKAAALELFPDGVFKHLDRLGAMTPRTVIAHGVWVDDAEIGVLARADATVVRNPGCNLRMRNGIAPLARYLQHGVRVAVGTDNCAMADDEDLLAELRLAGNLAREPDWNGPPPPGVDDLLAMATVNGAVAAQFGDEIGVLEPGKRADIAAFSLQRCRHPYLDPDMPLLEAFLARAQGADAAMTMVEGRILYRNGRYADASLDELEAQAAAAAQAARLPSDPANPERTQRYRGHLRDHFRKLTATSANPPVKS